MLDNKLFTLLILLAENNPSYARLLAVQIIEILETNADIIAADLGHIMRCLTNLNRGKYISAYYDYQQFVGGIRHCISYYAATDNQLFSAN